jgi:hypothetical protein
MSPQFEVLHPGGLQGRNGPVVRRKYKQCEIEFSPVATAVEFLGHKATVNEVNLLEEDVTRQPQSALRGSPYSIKTLELD